MMIYADTELARQRWGDLMCQSERQRLQRVALDGARHQRRRRNFLRRKSGEQTC